MITRALVAILSVLVSVACAPEAAAPGGTESAAAAEEPAGIAMDAATQARMGVKVTAITSVRAPKTVQGFGRVLDVSPLAALNADVSAAAAAAAASHAELQRLVALAAADQAASAKAVEAARALAASDAARSALAAGRIGLEWGAGIARLSQAQRGQLVSDVAAGRAAVVRIDTPNADRAGGRVFLRAVDDGSRIAATRIGPAASADARLQTAGVLVVVRGAAARALPMGRLLQADVEAGAPEQGFLLPRGAIIRSGEALQVYVRTAADRFEKRDVIGARPIGEGWLAPAGFAVGDMIVSEGAASVMAAERGPVEAE